jgi:signal transduction histidine kinase
MAWRQFAVSSAHRIGTTVSKISGELTVLMKSKATGEKETLESEEQAMRRHIRELQQLVREFADFVRPRELKMVPVDIKHLLEGAVQKAHAEFPHGPAVSLSLRSVSPSILADPEHTEAALMELLRNACTATPENGQVTVAAEKVMTAPVSSGTPPRAELLRITITDTGKGIPSEHRARIFEPFFTYGTQGMGLGLAIARENMESQGGNIRLDDTYTQGARFVIELPLKELQEERGHE